jgi:hypothetical protein
MKVISVRSNVSTIYSNDGKQQEHWQADIAAGRRNGRKSNSKVIDIELPSNLGPDREYKNFYLM